MREIIVNGEALPIYFGLRAIGDFAKATGRELSEVLAPEEVFLNMETIVALTAPALNEGARQCHTQKRYTEDDVWVIFDQNPTLLLTVSEIFMEAVTPIIDKLGAMAGKDGDPSSDGKSKKKTKSR